MEAPKIRQPLTGPDRPTSYTLEEGIELLWQLKEYCYEWEKAVCILQGDNRIFGPPGRFGITTMVQLLTQMDHTERRIEELIEVYELLSSRESNGIRRIADKFGLTL